MQMQMQMHHCHTHNPESMAFGPLSPAEQQHLPTHRPPSPAHSEPPPRMLQYDACSRVSGGDHSRIPTPHDRRGTHTARARAHRGFVLHQQHHVSISRLSDNEPTPEPCGKGVHVSACVCVGDRRVKAEGDCTLTPRASPCEARRIRGTGPPTSGLLHRGSAMPVRLLTPCLFRGSAYTCIRCGY